MSKKILRIALIIALIASFGFLLFAKIKNNQQNSERPQIVASNFPAYDFARSVAGEQADVKLLLKPGTDAHSFVPTPQDIIDIQNSDLFIYVGGESDTWIEKILNSIDKNKTHLVKMLDIVVPVEEELIEGMESEEEEEESDEPEYDEHVWTAPSNAILIANEILNELNFIDPAHKNYYDQNASDFNIAIREIDAEFKELIQNAKRHEIIVADRFPFRYFVDEYDLKYYAAFPGCAEQSEASATTVTFLINKVKADHIPAVLTIELSNQNIAKTISEATGAKILTLNSAHNISKDDFDAGKTYLDIMRENIEVLKEALN